MPNDSICSFLVDASHCHLSVTFRPFSDNLLREHRQLMNIVELVFENLDVRLSSVKLKVKLLSFFLRFLIPGVDFFADLSLELRVLRLPHVPLPSSPHSGPG